MTDDPQNVGPLFAALGARRIGVDHYTEHDFEMERVGRKQTAETYQKRLKILEAAGWEPFRGPFYYAHREFHGGHHPPGTKKRVPTKVAFAMFLDTNPEVELPAYKPHPHGWTRPRPPPGAGLIQQEIVSIEPMKMPSGKIFTLSNEYGTPEETKTRRETRARMDATFKGLPGVRDYGSGTRYPGAVDYIHVLLEDEKHRAGIPETWEGLPVDVKVKAEADERAEKAATQKISDEKHQEQAAWMAKARKF